MSENDGPVTGRTIGLVIGAIIVALPLAAYSLQLAAGLRALESVERKVSTIKGLLCEESAHRTRYACGGRDE